MRAPRGRGHPLAEGISALSQGSFLTATGELTHDERVKLGGVEISLDGLDVAIAETPIAADSNIDKRMDWRFLDLRRPEQNLVFRVQTTLEHALRTYWVDNDFIELHTTKLTASASESNAELFEVKYFEGTAFLAQSPLFFKQMAQPAGFGKVSEVGPASRADPSFASRHATEFASVDAEVSWIDSLEDVMNLHEDLLVAGLTAVKAKHGDEVLRADDDMDPEGERQIPTYVAEVLGHAFVFLTDYASSIRPFHHMRHDDDPSTTKSYDLIFNGVEISTGAQREHRIEVLEQQTRDRGSTPWELGFYSTFFHYGVPPHGGFGMGLSRVLMLLLHQSNLREVTYLFRGPTRLLPWSRGAPFGRSRRSLRQRDHSCASGG